MNRELECCVPTLQWNEAGVKPSSRVSETFDGIDLTAEETLRVNTAIVIAQNLPGVWSLTGELESVDDYDTLEHSGRMGRLATSLVVRFGGSDELAIQTVATGFGHDVWKKYLQDIVHMPCRLNSQEMERVRLHPKGGVEMAQAVDLPMIVRVGIGNHHGYGRNPYPVFPDRLWTPSDEIDETISDEHLLSMAIAAADAFDASRSPRPERRNPRTFEESIAWVNELNIADAVKQAFAGMFQQHVNLAA
jgi:HD-GYP domain-containing protein (c-di-GMP phosphodiesterase class II)